MAEPGTLRLDGGRPPPSTSAMSANLFWAALGAVTAVALASFGSRVAVGICAFAATTAISFERIEIGLGLLVVSIPVQDVWPVPIAGHTVTWTRLFLLAVAVAWLTRLLVGRARFRASAGTWWLGAYCCALVLSAIEARDLTLWAAETYRWTAALVVLVIASDGEPRLREMRAVSAGLAIGVLISAAIAVDQVVTGAGPESFAYRGVLRAYGLFGEPNPFAAYLEMAALPLLALSLASIRGRRLAQWTVFETIMLVVSGIGTATLVLTQSRGGGLGFIAGLATIVWCLWPRWGRRCMIAAMLAVAIAMATPPAEPVRALFGIDALFRSGPTQVTMDNFAAQERLAHWGAAFRMWMHAPLFGVGAGNFPERYREYTPVWRFRISRGHAHSAYLQAAAQAGTIGLICFVGLVCAFLRQSWRAVNRTQDRLARGAAIGSLAVTIAVAVHGMFDYVHVLSLSLLLSVIWGMVYDESARVAGGTLSHDGN